MEENITCKDGKEAFVGDTVRVIGMPERFFRDEKVDVTGVIVEIGWYEDGDYFGFKLDDTNIFYLTNCDEIYLVSSKRNQSI